MSVWFVIIGLIIFGFLLILMEVFLIPGFNVFGIFGFIAIVAGIITAYSDLPVWYAHGILFFSVIASFVLVRLVIRSKAWKRIVLDTRATREAGFAVQKLELQDLIGKEGVTHTLLRPAGTAIIDGKKYDVVSEGRFIERGTNIQVVLVEGNRIVVR